MLGSLRSQGQLYVGKDTTGSRIKENGSFKIHTPQTAVAHDTPSSPTTSRSVVFVKLLNPQNHGTCFVVP